MLTTDDYLAIAQTFSDSTPFPSLPPLTRDLFTQLCDLAQTQQYHDPHLSWALLALADHAAGQQPDRQLQGEAAWWLAWGANAFFRPNLATPALDRATTLLTGNQWQAACTWQRYALPWTTHGSYATLTSQLESAYALLQQWRPAWAQQCQISLAFAHLLNRHYTIAQQHLSIATQQTHQFHKAYALLIQSALLRRENQFIPALTAANAALRSFEQAKAPFGIARAHEFLASCYLHQENLSAATHHFETALADYQRIDIPMQQAACLNGLAQIANQQGTLAIAQEHITTALNLFREINLIGGLADTLMNNAHHHAKYGQHRQAIKQLQEARQLYAQLDATRNWCAAGIQEAYSHLLLGNLQHALGLLDEVADYAHEPDLQASQQLTRAQIYTTLDQYEQAQQLLSLAEKNYYSSELTQSHCKTLIAQAVVKLQQNHPVRETLDTAAQIAEHAELYAQQATIHYLRGEAARQQNKPELAESWLNQALTQLHGADKIRCLLALARCQSDRQKALAYCDSAFALATHYPALRWQACTTRLTWVEDETSKAKWLHKGLEALLTIRRRLSSPDLASDFWQGPQKMIDRAVRLTYNSAQIDLLQRFVEESKALTTVRQLATAATIPHSEQTATAVLEQQRVNINWLVTQLNKASATDIHALKIKLAAAEADYADQLRSLQRQHPAAEIALQPFEWQACYKTLNTLSAQWIALDYYDLGDEIICIVGYPDGKRQAVSLPRPNYALKLLADHESTPSQHVLQQLAQLIPQAVKKQLTTETLLLIAPHQALHMVPWAGIWHDNAPLVWRTIPVIIPSLHALQLLLLRPQRTRQQQGCLLAVTQFENGYADLPAVAAEATWLHDYTHQLNFHLHDLSQARVWSDITAHKGLFQQFDFWHIATHAFFDRVLGWNSGFALAAEDIWIDQLWELAPLPPLLSFSACDGGQRLVLAGDEQIGIPLVCLAAGANSVIGSLRPLVDSVDDKLMHLFYTHYFAGLSPALALAAAQRTLLQKNNAPANWYFIHCFGLP